MEINRIYQSDIADIELPENSIDLIFTDPPYHRRYLYLYEELAKLAARVLKPGAYCIAYAGHGLIPQVLSLMMQHLEYEWMISLSLDYSHKMFVNRVLTRWRPVLILRKPGLHKKHKWIVDRMYAGQYDKSLHPWQQGIEPAVKYISAFTIEGDIVLDPFCGSGTTAVACVRAGRNFLAYDIDPEAVRIATERVELEKPENKIQIPLFV